MIIKRLNKRIKTFGLGIQKLFARKENRDLVNWKLPKDYVMPEDAMMHYDKRQWYNQYNVVWSVPGKLNKNGEPIQVNKFILDKSYLTDTEFQNDLAELKKRDDADQILKRLDICIQEIKNNFVFNDNDDRLYLPQYYEDSSTVYGGWDTETHYIARFQSSDMDVLPYTKRLTEKHRLAYKVHRPEKVGGSYVCLVTLVNCYGHVYEGVEYGISKNAIANTAKISTLKFLNRHR